MPAVYWSQFSNIDGKKLADNPAINTLDADFTSSAC